MLCQSRLRPILFPSSRKYRPGTTSTLTRLEVNPKEVTLEWLTWAQPMKVRCLLTAFKDVVISVWAELCVILNHDFFQDEFFKTDMPYQRQTCLIEEPLETDMPYWRTIGDQNALTETHEKPTRLIGEQLDMLDPTCWSSMGLQSVMLVSYVGLWWDISVSDETCRSLMGHIQTFLSPIRHVDLR